MMKRVHSDETNFNFNIKLASILHRTGPAVWYAGQMEPQIGSFSSYVYFLICPVLLYRDRYPRKPANPWKAFVYFIQVFH